MEKAKDQNSQGLMKPTYQEVQSENSQNVAKQTKLGVPGTKLVYCQLYLYIFNRLIIVVGRTEI